ncbi:hypothetical protein EV421DRAFT_1421044 [Armillaria borealis]|uniref:Uncharacterized protein n=1 Tax=Armillaria borealis TaxID=47425 RepID=A0AA39JV38_9AGAR|nr:hypothetical protein EV421DRAFT_1421044 [Armillaria borealis]
MLKHSSTKHLPAPSIHPEILTAPTADDAVEDASYHLIAQLKLATGPSEESAVIDFVVALSPGSLGYIRRPRAIRTRKEFRFLICGSPSTPNLTSASSIEMRTILSSLSKKINGLARACSTHCRDHSCIPGQ